MEKVTLHCAGGCGATIKEDTREVVGPMGERKRVPMQVHPYICLLCWLGGWRHEGPQADGSYRIFNVGRAGSPAP